MTTLSTKQGKGNIIWIISVGIVMIRFLIFTLVGLIGIGQCSAQKGATPQLATLFAECAQIKGIEIMHLDSPQLESLFKGVPFSAHRSMVKDSSNARNEEKNDGKSEIQGSVSIITINALDTFPSAHQEKLKTLFNTHSFADCELITLAQEAGESVRIYAHKDANSDEKTLYIISMANKEYTAICLKGVFAVKSHVQMVPDAQQQ